MKILVLQGGESSEREISFRSAGSVIDALEKLGIDVITYDPKDGLDALLAIAKNVDLVFPILHGKGGEDGKLQKLFEDNDIKFLGSGSDSSNNCLNKEKYYEICKQNSILIPDYSIVTFEEFKKSNLAKKPFVLKPIEGGSAIDTIIVRTTPDNLLIFEDVFKKYNKIILQELIPGIEVTCGILGETPLPVIEIIPPKGEEFDFENRYNNKSQELCPPKHISNTIQLQIQELALKSHKTLKCLHLSRTDMIVDKKNNIFVLETNTIPGLTKTSLYPKEAKSKGLSMQSLVKEFIKLSMSR